MNKTTYSKLCHVAKRLGDSYPIYDILFGCRELENFRFVCNQNKFKVCPNNCFANRCKLSIGRYKHCCVVFALLCFVCLFAVLQKFAKFSAIEDPWINHLHISRGLICFLIQHTSLRYVYSAGRFGFRFRESAQSMSFV